MTDDVIIAKCQDYDLLVPDTPYLTRLRKKNKLPTKYKPKYPNKTTKKWWKKHGVYDMWRQSAAARRSLKILENSKLREIVEYIILSPLDVEDYNGQLPRDITPKVVKTYEHYFFNVGLLSSDDLHNFLQIKGGLSRSLASCSDRGMAKDLLKYITEGEDIGASSGALSKKLIDLISLRLLRIRFEGPSLDDASMLKGYANALRTSQDVYNESSAASEELLDLFLRFDHGSEKEDLKTFNELKKGE